MVNLLFFILWLVLVIIIANIFDRLPRLLRFVVLMSTTYNCAWQSAFDKDYWFNLVGAIIMVSFAVEEARQYIFGVKND